MRKLGLTLLAGMLLLLFAGPAWADGFSTCPNLGPLGDESNAFAGCSALITFNADGSVTTAFNPQSDVEDALVGVINNSGNTIHRILIIGQSDDPSDNEAFALDGDFLLCLDSIGCTGYEGPGVRFHKIFSEASGVVEFYNGLAPGHTGWFGLEGTLNPENFGGEGGLEGAATGIRAVPEPSSMWLFGSGLFGLLGLARKLRKS